MSAALLNFPSRGRYSCREIAAYEPATVAAERMVCITAQLGDRINLGRITITARHPRSIIVRADNQNRFQIPSIPPPDGPLAGEAGAYCCRLTGLFLDARGIGRALNFSRLYTAPGSLISVLLQPSKQSQRRFANALKSFRGLFLGHAKQHIEGIEACPENRFPKPERLFPRVT